MNSTIRDYLESAENTAISRTRALLELKNHGIVDTDEFMPSSATVIFTAPKMYCAGWVTDKKGAF